MKSKNALVFLVVFCLVVVLSPLTKPTNYLSTLMVKNTESQPIKPPVLFYSQREDGNIFELLEVLQLNKKNHLEKMITGEEVRRFGITKEQIEADSSTGSKVEELGEDSGLKVRIENPEKFLSLTAKSYLNALITTGVSNVSLSVGSPQYTTGDTALAGIFYLYGNDNYSIERMNIAQEEIVLLGYLSLKYNVPEVNNRINGSIAEMKLNLSRFKGTSISSSLNKSISYHWKKYNLPELEEKDKKYLHNFLSGYQRTTAVSDVETNRLLKSYVLDVSNALGSEISQKAYSEEQSIPAKIFDGTMRFMDNLFKNVFNY